MIETSNSKRLAVNTIIIYGKLIISTIISFVVSRLVLKALGASDYGLYNVVGGIVALLNTLGITMVATSYRFLAVEIGKGEKGDPNRVYNTVLVIHVLLAVFLVLVGETIGIFYINNYLNVDPLRLSDARFVLHLSLLTTAFSVISIPANGLIVARERFLFTSIIEVVSAFLRLGLVLLLMHIDGNRLRLYAIFLAVVQVLMPIAYQIYCRNTDREVVRWAFNRVKDDYRAVVKFASGILMGALACMVRVQGAAMIINYFFGTVLNAAFGLATQVWTASDQFSNSLRQAAIPQIMKSHSSGDKSHSIDLVYWISRYSFLLMLLPAVPLIIGNEGVLSLWLGADIPEYTGIFIVLLMCSGLINSSCSGFDGAIQATGKIWKNQIGYSIINLMLLPIMFVMYKSGMPPYSNAIAMIVISLAIVIFQSCIMRELTSFSIKRYLFENIIPSIITAIISFVPLILLSSIANESFTKSIWLAIISFAWAILVVFLFGMNKREKELLKKYIENKLNR